MGVGCLVQGVEHVLQDVDLKFARPDRCDDRVSVITEKFPVII